MGQVDEAQEGLIASASHRRKLFKNTRIRLIVKQVVPIVDYLDVLATYKNLKSGERALEKYKKWFPLYSSVALAGVVADLMCDGHVQPPPKLRLDYTSKSTLELKRFGNELYGLFGVNGKSRPCRCNRYGVSFNYGVNCKPLCRILILCGVPAGRKVAMEFTTPDWILGDKELFRRFVQRMFTCEGHVSSNGSPEVGIQMWKAKGLLKNGLAFFWEIKEGMENYFGIKTSRPFLEKRENTDKDGLVTKAIRLKIKRKEAISQFAQEIGFEDDRKQQLLEQVGRRSPITLGTC